METESQWRFDAAVKYLADNKNKLSFDQTQQLTLYGLFKQANHGPCTAPKPSLFQFTEKAKWTAWNDLGQMSKDEAMTRYAQTVDKLVPGWDGGLQTETKPTETETTGSAAKSAGKPGMVVWSQPVAEAEDDEGVEKDIWFYASTGDLSHLGTLLESNSFTIDQQDDDGRSPLMWAVDKGHVNVINDLLKRGASVHLRDIDGQTVLHYAALSENEEVVKLLLNHGADKNLADNDGTRPAELADNEQLRALLE